MRHHEGPVVDTRRPWPTDDPLEAALIIGSLFTGTRIGFAFVGGDGRYVAANGVFAGWLGSAAERLPGEPAAGTPHLSVGGRLDELIAEAAPVVDLDERLEPPGVAGRDLRLSYLPILGSREQVLGVAIVARDVTAGKALEDRLRDLSALHRRESALLRSVVEHVPVGIVVIRGREYRYVLVNEQGRRMAPFEGEVVGRTLDELFGDRPEVVSLARGLYDRVFESGETLRMEELAVPFGDAGSFEGNRYYEVTLTPIVENGGVAGILVVYVEMTEQVRRRREVETKLAREHELALILQQSLLPATLPEAADVRFASVYRPGRSGELVGGDFFDVLQWRGRWLVVLGDVQGKGVRAAGTTALVRHALRGSLLHRDTLAGVLEDLNRILLDEGSNCLCTAVLAALETRSRPARLSVALAGHPPPVLVSPSGGVDDRFGRGLVLGAVAEARYREVERAMQPGETLLLYSDGLPDAQAPGAWIDVPAAVRSAGDAARHPDSLVAALRELALAGGPPRDDLAMLAVQLLPEARSAASA